MTAKLVARKRINKQHELAGENGHKHGVLTRLTLNFFVRPKPVLLLWIAVLSFGLMSYATLLRREGFPSINIPVTIVQGTYAVNDPGRVDAELAQPFSEVALQQDGVKSVQTQSRDNFFSAVVSYETWVEAQGVVDDLKTMVTESNALPLEARLQFSAPYFSAIGPSSDKVDVAISVFSRSGQSSEQLYESANTITNLLNDDKPRLVQEFFTIEQYAVIDNPLGNQEKRIQKSFDRFGVKDGDGGEFFESVIIAVSAVPEADVLALDGQVHDALAGVSSQLEDAGLEARVSASFAPAIRDNINELQKALLEGLLAVLVVSSLVITFRASIITVLSMLTVIAITLGLLYLVGYTLNVITLFSLILGLSLVVDDTIIMAEAIDAGRRTEQRNVQIIAKATQKVSLAMVAATATAAISFAPLLFVSGILGDFIRVIPITIILSLIISLLVALFFIPLFARYLMLGNNTSSKNKSVHQPRHIVADFILRPMMWARASRRRMTAVAASAILFGITAIAGAGFFANKIPFDIFPATKDTNGLTLQLTFPEGTSIAQAQKIVGEAEDIFTDVVGDNFSQASYYNSGSMTSATLYADIVSYAKRDITSVELVDNLNGRFADFPYAEVRAGQQDIGPPASNLRVQIVASDRAAADRAAAALAEYLRSVALVRADGSTATIRAVSISSDDVHVRSNNTPVIEVTLEFEDADTSTLISLAQTAIEEEFNDARLAGYGLLPDAIKFDLGQEGENQESFRTLLLALPILLIVMYVVLALQFKSLLQPVLIFMAVPFSLLGVSFGLFATNNALSFFSMLGFFALVGLSIKNTILLTDYANQAKRSGLGPVDAIAAALRERFRPLLATSITAIVSLVPLAILSPFWQGLAVVLIFGLISSTLLVVTVFPYYYIVGEFFSKTVARPVAVTAILLGAAGGLLLFAKGLLLAVIGSLVLGLGAVVAGNYIWNKKLQRSKKE